jgi:hypothetical protein
MVACAAIAAATLVALVTWAWLVVRKRTVARTMLTHLLAGVGDPATTGNAAFQRAWLRVYSSTRPTWYLGKRLKREIEVVLAEQVDS